VKEGFNLSHREARYAYQLSGKPNRTLFKIWKFKRKTLHICDYKFANFLTFERKLLILNDFAINSSKNSKMKNVILLLAVQGRSAWLPNIHAVTSQKYEIHVRMISGFLSKSAY